MKYVMIYNEAYEKGWMYFESLEAAKDYARLLEEFGDRPQWEILEVITLETSKEAQGEAL